MKSSLLLTGAAIAAAILCLPLAQAGEKAPESISDVMKLTHKGETSMVKKISEGKATDLEIRQLVAHYEFMRKQEPPRGSKESWESKTAAVLSASKGLAGKEAGSLDQFKKAINCKACHSEHKPE